VALDGYSSLTLKIHIIEHLRLHIFAHHGSGALKQTVGQSGFAMVNMRNNAEISDIFHQTKICHQSDCKITKNLWNNRIKREKWHRMA